MRRTGRDINRRLESLTSPLTAFIRSFSQLPSDIHRNVVKRTGDGPHRAGLGAGFPASRSREMAKAFTDREHTDTIKCGVNLFSGWKRPIGPIYCGVQGLTCSPPSCHSHFPHPFPWDCGADGVPAHTARLLDDEILTLIQATGNASLSLTSPTPASAAGHVS